MSELLVTRRELFGTLFIVTRAASGETVSRLHIGEDGRVTLMTGKVDMGQGSRTLLTQVVCEELGIPASQVTVVMGDTARVPDDGGTFASLTTPQTVPAVRAAARAAAKKRPAGRPAPLANVTGRDIVTGAKKYPSDFKLPGMKRATVTRPKRSGLPLRDELWAEYRSKSIPPKPGEGGRYPALIAQGDASSALDACECKLTAEYRTVNIAHVPMEPRAAVAKWNGNQVTVWTGTQVPFGVRRELATTLGIPEANVRIISMDFGGGFGGKHRAEVEIEAARLAKDSPVPVQVAWTREEEFTCSYCRPAAVVEITGGLDAAGKIHGWIHRNYNAGAPSLRPPYAIPNFSCEFHRSAVSPLKHGAYRSLAAVANTFARESHVDALARTVEQDPVQLRLRNIEDVRLREAIERAAQRFGWRNARGQGMSCNIEKDARLALFVEMDGRKVKRMVLALDVGAILNPDNLRNQAEGALIQGIGGALFEELKWDAHGITNGSLSRYRVPRFSDVPVVEVMLIDRPAIESAGAGEVSITVVAPAIAAALRRDSGEPLRSLPLLPSA